MRRRWELEQQQRDREIEEARTFYDDLKSVESRMEVRSHSLRNPDRWLDAISELQKARVLLQQFIGEHITADIDWLWRHVRVDDDNQQPPPGSSEAE